MNQNEQLIKAWIRLSVALRNDRIMRFMTFNEAVICSFIYEEQIISNAEINIKRIGERACMAKSLVNRVLNDLGKRGIIERYKNEHNKKNVYVKLTDLGLEEYKKEHVYSVIFASRVSKIMGDKVTSAIEILETISDSVDLLFKENEK